MSTRIHKNLSDDDIHSIKNGVKTAHCEIKKKLFSNLNTGDIITFFDSKGESINVYVTSVQTYENFEDFLEEHVENTGSHTLNIRLEAKRYRDELIDPRDEERYKLVGFEFHLIKKYQTPERRRVTEFTS